MPPDQIEKVKALDAADEGAGYSCFGGIGVDSAYPTGLWVPGNDAPLVPPHAGVGYYTGFAVADQSNVVLWRATSVVTEVPHAIQIGDLKLSLPPNSTTTIDSIGDVMAKARPPR